MGNFIDSENNLASLKYVVNILSLEVTFPKKGYSVILTNDLKTKYVVPNSFGFPASMQSMILYKSL